MSSVTDQAAELNRTAWDSFRRQRDEGLVNIRPDSAEAILAGKCFLEEGPENPWNPAGDPDKPLTTIEWEHTLGSLVTAVARVGLRIDALLELPDTDETRPDYGVEYGAKGRTGRIILAATKPEAP